MKTAVAFIVMALAWSISQPGVALPLTPQEFGANYQLFSGLGSYSSYDANTDAYTFESGLGTASSPGQILDYPLGTSVMIGDVVGGFSVTATVDNTGTMLSGTFAWIGGSASLGIAAGSTLLQGTIDDIFFDIASTPIFQILGTVNAIDPLLGNLLGGVESILLYDFAGVSLEFFDDPWNANFAGSSFTHADWWLAQAQQIAEPATLLLIFPGLLLLTVTGLRRTRA